MENYVGCHVKSKKNFHPKNKITQELSQVWRLFLYLQYIKTVVSLQGHVLLVPYRNYDTIKKIDNNNSTVNYLAFKLSPDLEPSETSVLARHPVKLKFYNKKPFISRKPEAELKNPNQKSYGFILKTRTDFDKILANFPGY